MPDKYSEQLEKERAIIAQLNPFSKRRDIRSIRDNHSRNGINKDGKGFKYGDTNHRSVPFVNKKDKSSNYFHLILGSDFEDLEMEIRGLRYYKEIDEKTGKEILITKVLSNHYLSEEGAEDLLVELKAHLSPDIKLGILTREEFLMMQDIIRKFLISYISNNMYKLGMDSEQKQRKAPTLIVMMLARIRAVYSRSVSGIENQRSHGDITLSGGLDYDKEDKFRLEDIKN